MSSDPRKQSYSLDADVLAEMYQAAQHHEASLSWVAQQAWAIAREEIAKMPSAPSWEAKQRALAAAQAQAEPATQQAPPVTQQAPAPPRPPRLPARPPEAPLSAWEVERLGSIHSRSAEPLDHQGRELYPWDDDGPTI